MAYLYPPEAGGGAAGGQPGTLPTTAKWATALTGTSASPTYTDLSNSRGVLLSVAFGLAADWRGAFRVDSGVSASALISHGAPTSGAGDTGSGVCLTRYGGTDNRVLLWRLGERAGGSPYLSLARFTDYAGTEGANLVSFVVGNTTSPVWLWLAETGGNIVAKASMDGVTWATCYSAAVATAYGTAGATTMAGIGTCGFGNKDVQQMIVSRYQ